MVKYILTCFILIFSTLFIKDNHLIAVSQHKKMKIVTIFHPSGDSGWCDILISRFVNKLQETGLGFEFLHRGFEPEEDWPELVDKIAKDNPDVVFIPDDVILKALAKSIESKTKALVLFVSSHSDKSDINLIERQAGVYCDPPIASFLESISQIRPLKSIGIVASSVPGAHELTKLIVSKAPKEIKFEIKLTNKWDDYEKSFKSFESRYDAIFALMPINVKNSNGTFVQPRQINYLISNSKKPVLGYGILSELKRTFTMQIDPRELGESAAMVLIKYRSTGEKIVKKFSSYATAVGAEHARNLNIKIPEDYLYKMTVLN